MAGSLNKVILIGRLGKDPQLNYTQGGTPVANFSLATDEGYKDQNGNRVEKTEWHRVVCWSKTGELVSNYLRKGSLAMVEGKLETRKWQDQQGNDRYTTEIRALNVQFLESRKQAQQDNYAPAPEVPQQEGPPLKPSVPAGYENKADQMDDMPF